MSKPESAENGPITASVERLRGELDRWMESAIAGGEKALGVFGFGQKGSWKPVFDIVETHDQVIVHVDLPGVEANSINVALAGNMLTLKGRRTNFIGDSSDLVHVRNRPEGDFEHAIPMPSPVNADAVSADVVNGVLTVRLAKVESAKARQIQINAVG